MLGYTTDGAAFFSSFFFLFCFVLGHWEQEDAGISGVHMQSLPALHQTVTIPIM